MTLYNMVGCNTSRTHSGGVTLRAGQFRSTRNCQIKNTTINNTNVIIKQNNRACTSAPTYCAVPQQSNGLADILNFIMTLGGLLTPLFKKDTSPPEVQEGKGAPEQEVETPPPKQEVVAEEPVIAKSVDPQDVYAAEITPNTVQEEGATHTVRHGECWYDVLDAKYPGIPNTDRKAAMRALKQANGMTNPNSADMPRKMYLPNEITVNGHTYKLNNDNDVIGTVKEFTTGGMYNANIPSFESTTYSVTGTKNGENAYSATFDQKAQAEAAKAKWEAQNDSE